MKKEIIYVIIGSWQPGIHLFIFPKGCSLCSFRPPGDAGTLGLLLWCNELCPLLAVLCPGIPEFGLWLCFVVLLGLCGATEGKPICSGTSDTFITEIIFGTESWNEGLQPKHPSTAPQRLSSDFVMIDTKAQTPEKISMLFAYLEKREEESMSCSSRYDERRNLTSHFCSPSGTQLSVSSQGWRESVDNFIFFFKADLL